MRDDKKKIALKSFEVSDVYSLNNGISKKAKLELFVVEELERISMTFQNY